MRVAGPCGRWLAALWCLAACHVVSAASAPGHPRLLLGAGEAPALREESRKSPLFAAAVSRTAARLEPHLAQLPAVPAPRDAGGGYTHERHKANGILLAEAGALFQWTGETRYAEFARQLLLGYAELYPQLGPHPVRKSRTPGRLFWQSLNESVWLVHAAMGYDGVYEALAAQDRRRIETNLLRPVARFLSTESPRMFNRIHNHGTWATAAVGMTGYVLDDERLVRMALLGTLEDGKGGFLAQLRHLFSPDGYYLEGPYYQRYAMMPFVLFARAIERNEPQRAIFEYRNGVLGKAIRTTIQLTYGGRFFPVNDALPEKGLDTMELDHAIAIAYGQTADPALLSLVDDRSHLVLTADALRLALAKEAGEEQPFPFASRHFRDGADGQRGALTVLRGGTGASTPEGLPRTTRCPRAPEGYALVFKATSHGLGHGHFDRLHWMFYDNGVDVVADYGAARFLNVVQKAGGRYLPENTSWAKQTVAHNTLVVDEASQFQGDVKQADASWPADHFFHASANAQIVSAVEKLAYPGIALRRTMLLIDWPALDCPFVLDVWRALGTRPRRFDLPLYFKGHMIETVPRLEAASSLRPLGDHNGYQHLWLLGEAAAPAGERLAFTWLRAGRFYTYAVQANASLRAMMTRVGAGDPDFSLRPEPGLMLRADQVDNLALVALLEPHGEYSSSREFTRHSKPQVADMRWFDADGKDVVTIRAGSGEHLSVALSYDRDADAAHVVETATGRHEWRGYYRVSMADAAMPNQGDREGP